MKQAYETPKAEMMEFDYSETITASMGNSYQEYVNTYTGCKETPTGEWYAMKNDSDASCLVHL